MLKQWYQFTLARRCYRSTINVALEIARQLCARDDMTAAGHYVRNALRLAHGRYVRCFLDGGSAIREVLQRISVGRATVGTEQGRYAEELLASFAKEDSVNVTQAPPASPGSVSTNPAFSSRELDILELAADDLSNREISRRLALSENTVKWYWKAIFRKLRVHRRAKAVSLARSTGVIF